MNLKPYILLTKIYKMKKLTLFLIVTLFFFVGCTNKKKDSIEGVWQMVSAYWFDSDSINYNVPQDIEGGAIKAWLNGYVLVAGTFKIDSIDLPAYVAATYTLDGNKYVETIIYHDRTVSPGTIINMILEIKNDTLIQKWPADENWNLNEKAYMWEKYVRIK